MIKRIECILKNKSFKLNYVCGIKKKTNKDLESINDKQVTYAIISKNNYTSKYEK